MSSLLPNDRDLHYPDQSHRWMCPDPDGDEDAWADRVRVHIELHRTGIDHQCPADRGSDGYPHPTRYCVRHLPLDRDSERAKRKQEHAKLMTDGRWEKHRQEREERHAAAVASAASGVGSLSDREVLLLGAAIYWCEGAKGNRGARRTRSFS